MDLASSGRRALAAPGLAALLLSLASLGCPGPEPESLSGEGGDAGSSATGPTSTSSSGKTVGASAATTGAGGDPGAGGSGGDGVVASVGGGSPGTGTGGQGGGGVGGGGSGAGGASGAGGCAADLEIDPDNCGACGYICGDEGVDVRLCIGGHCQPVCTKGFSDLPDAGALDADDGCETPWRRVFVSEEPQALPFEGLGAAGAAAADERCQVLGQDLGGTWLAWISDDQIDPPNVRFTQRPVPYWLLDETVIATSFDDLVDGTIEAPIEVTENGDSLFALNPGAAAFPVWTATDPSGGATPEDCSDWTLAADEQSGRVGLVGDLAALNLPDSAWTSAPILRNCTADGVRLYCFEQ